MNEDEFVKPLTPEDKEKQDLIDFFSDRYAVMEKERKKREEAFLLKIGSREIEEPGYQKVKK